MNKLIGNIFKNTSTEENQGVLVNSSDENLHFFNLEDNQIPVFKKIKKDTPFTKTGNINDDTQTKMKNQLLKYYHTNNLENDEIKLEQLRLNLKQIELKLKTLE